MVHRTETALYTRHTMASVLSKARNAAKEATVGETIDITAPGNLDFAEMKQLVIDLTKAAPNYGVKFLVRINQTLRFEKI